MYVGLFVGSGVFVGFAVGLVVGLFVGSGVFVGVRVGALVGMSGGGTAPSLGKHKYSESSPPCSPYTPSAF